ncbi:iron-containing alcohol dehydrogenase [Weissella tructae]|uniref:BdhA_1 protein n=2 Tax=Weissella TaxID=46255 RepID=A0A075U0J3_9LACO|nr:MULTISPECIES: iron-containing alcohol dehydrogenase [Weissella]AIG66060.1 BdhA_1 protein [Weissella tructae]AIM63439.1 BdhA_1 protein [Weissella ceti]AIM64774.1 BdhA_1 protein [Weissella ceti]ELA07431.1 NADH-dependent butanol dehydrogenase [Weissella ceti NC36]QVV91212.1 iron-containing alcohol dehydrogenase [Weissella tructae]
MNEFTYGNQTEIRFGEGRFWHELAETLAPFGKRVLFVYGGASIKASGVYDQIMAQLVDFDVTELAGVEPNPKIDSVRKGQALAQAEDVDVILAVGGGSVIDASKVIASAKYYVGDAWDLVLDSELRFEIDQVPVVDILTLAATGTEMNEGSVISNPETQQKLATFGPNTPAVSFEDPSLTYSVSAYQTSAGAMDIMSHLLEQYFDNARATDVQDGMIEGMLRSVIKWGPIAVAEPKNYDARANLMWGSTQALNGLVGTGKDDEWTVHPIEHEVSAYYDITHAVGLGILTPHWMKMALNTTTQAKFARYAEQVWGVVGADEHDVALQGIAKTAEWIKQMNIPATLPEVGITSDVHFKEMAQAAVENGNLSAAYVPMDAQMVENLYRAAMEPVHLT